MGYVLGLLKKKRRAMLIGNSWFYFFRSNIFFSASFKIGYKKKFKNFMG